MLQMASLQFVRINYYRSRNVYIDGVLGGKTNTIMRVDQGTHVFDLGPDPNYCPEQYRKRVKGTTAISPLVLEFEPEACN